MPKTVVITQSNYLPWRGYFDLLSRADVVVLYDSVQFTRRDWRNRNRIKTADGPAWITIPVQVKGRYLQSIDETHVLDPGWAQQHARMMRSAYARAPAFESTAAWLFPLLSSLATEPLLTNINERLLRSIMDCLGIATPLVRCTSVLDPTEMQAMDPSARLAALCQALGGERYLSGPAAKAYLDFAPFTRAGIEVEWMSYAGYPSYPQLWGEFEPNVSVVDLMFNTGDDAPRFVKPASA
jgi:hypothetical protein